MDEKQDRLSQEHIVTAVKDVFNDNTFADVTLVCDDQIQIPAHKLVLSACSPILKDLLLSNPHSHPLLYLGSVKQQELKSVLQIMYLGETTIHQKRINEFLDIARELELNEISQYYSVEQTIEQTPVESVIVDTDDTENKIISSTTGEFLDLNLPGYEDSNDKSKHEGERYSCNQCDYQAKKRKYLKQHQKSIHEGLRYSCNHCPEDTVAHDSEIYRLKNL